MKTKDYSIKWLYRHVPIVTYCDIYYGHDTTDKTMLFATGDARCQAHDHFCKETGRKLSLARALKNANLPKEERTTIWEIYRNTKLGGRW